MKKSITVILAFTICFCAFLNANSVYIDGYDDGSEWNGAEAQLILNGESNCKVNFGLIKSIIEPESNTVYLCVMFKDPEISIDNPNAGVAVQAEGSEPFLVTVTTTPVQYDVDRFYFDGAVKVDENCGVTCEIRLGLKYGLPDVINGKLRFYDSDGTPSNIYDFSIVNNTTVNSNSFEYENHSSSTSDKTTSKSSKSTSKPEKASTVKQKTDNEDINISADIFDLLFASETTAKSSTVTSSREATKAVKTTKRKKSGSYSTLQSTAPEATVTEKERVTGTEPESTSEAVTSAKEFDTYKVITLVVGGLTLVAISVLGTLKSGKEKTGGKENGNKNE